MELELFTIFLIGFLGGFSHCIGMCGGFVMTYTIKIQESDVIAAPSRWQTLYPHLLYNSGRVLTYVILGEIFGFLGTPLVSYLPCVIFRVSYNYLPDWL